MAVPSTPVLRFDLSVPVREIDLAMNRMDFIGPQVLRPRLVSKQAANVGKIPLKWLSQSVPTRQARGAGYRRGSFEFDQYSYACLGYGWEEPLDDEVLHQYADLIDAENVHAERATDFVLSEYERDVAATVFNSTTWTGAALTTAVATPWSDPINADPIGNIDAAREKVILTSGLEPNALILNNKNWRRLIYCRQIFDRVSFSEEATPNLITALLAQILDLKYILVAGGMTNAANPQHEASIARIWSNNLAMVARVAETDDPQEACLGRTFIWTGDGPAAAGTKEELALIVEQYRDEEVRGMITRARNNRDIQIMYKEAGNLLTGLA